MKIKTTLYLSSIVLLASLAWVPRALAQVPCDGSVLVKASLLVDWPQLQYDAGHSGCNPYETILSASTVGTLGRKWSQGNDWAASLPVVANGVAYFTTFSDIFHIGDVYAYEAVTGNALWKNENADGIQYFAPAVASGIVYLGDSNGRLSALDGKTGNVLWSYFLGAPVSQPVVANGVVYAGSASGHKVYAVNAQTGQLLWTYTTAGAVPTPAVKGGTVYVASDQVYALNGSTGALIWKAPVSSQSPPVVVGNAVYIASDQLYALNASTGAPAWNYPVLSVGSPAVATGRVYVGGKDSNVYALNASTGAFLWKYTTPDEWVATPAVANGLVYAVSNNNFGDGPAHLSFLDAKTGALVSYLTSDGFTDSGSSPVVVNGVVYVSFNSGDGAVLRAYSNR